MPMPAAAAGQPQGHSHSQSPLKFPRKLIDEATVPFLERYMEAFAAWATSYPRS